MLSSKEILYITEKITRRFEIELPMEIEAFTVENEKLHISFHKLEIAKIFELTKGVVIEFDTESRIIGLSITPMEDYLPRTSLDFDETNEI